MKLSKVVMTLLIVSSLFGRDINLNFQNLEIKDFIKSVAKITHKNILICSNISGKVNFISVKPIKDSEIYDILVNILKSKGYTIIRDNGFLNVVRSVEAIHNAPPLNSSLREIQTSILYLNNISARDAYKQISYLKSKYGKIIINNEKNLLIVTDYPKNIAIIREILIQVDTKAQPHLKFFQLKNANSRKAYPKIKELIRTMYNSKIYDYKIILNDSTNSIIVVGALKVVKEVGLLVSKLDKKPQESDTKTEIITLKNSDVVSIQKVLLKIVNAKYKKEKPSITANNETNSLVIIATPMQMASIKTIINALDIPKQQVYVKARILEISNVRAANVGIKYGLQGGLSNSSGLYTMSANMGGPAVAIDTAALGLSLPSVTQGLALGATLDLLQIEGAAKKLSEPSLLCINNTPSTIYVGKTVSVLTGKTTSTQTSQSYTRQDIGLTLKIKPRIDSDSKVSLNITSVIEDILPGGQADMPTTSKRNISTTTIVQNGQSIIIGGLVRNNKDITTSKVPFLGDIPFLGSLFRHTNSNEDRTTLVIVLTPYIIKTSEDFDKLRPTLSKLNQIEQSFVKKVMNNRSKLQKKSLEDNNNSVNNDEGDFFDDN